MRWGPWEVNLASTCRTPIWKPRHLVAATERSHRARCWYMGRMEGQLEPVSLKYLQTPHFCEPSWFPHSGADECISTRGVNGAW